MKQCECCEKDEDDNWILNPCCYDSGRCEVETDDHNETLDFCLHCGAEMFKEGGFWFHHEQKELPIEEREPQLGI